MTRIVAPPRESARAIDAQSRPHFARMVALVSHLGSSSFTDLHAALATAKDATLTPEARTQGLRELLNEDGNRALRLIRARLPAAVDLIDSLLTGTRPTQPPVGGLKLASFAPNRSLALTTAKPNAISLRATDSGRPEVATGAFERYLDQVTDSSCRGGCTTQPLLDGKASFAARKKLIESAQKSIHLQTFILTDDETGRETVRLLSEKAKQGVKVRVIVDAMGQKMAGSADKILDDMRAAGIEVRVSGELSKLFRLNKRAHEKILVVDGDISILGGMNVGDKYAQRALREPDSGSKHVWRDIDVILRGPAVSDAQRAFLRNWVHLGPRISHRELSEVLHRSEYMEAGGLVRFVHQRPLRGEYHVHRMYLASIECARTSIDIETAYFVPDRQIREALIAAAKRGVKVRIVTNDPTTSNHPVVNEAARYYYNELVAAGVEIYEKGGFMIHSKAAVIDGKYSIIGSANLNGRSSRLDAETAIGSTDPSLVKALSGRLEDMIPESTRIVAKESNWLVRMRQWMLSRIAYTF